MDLKREKALFEIGQGRKVIPGEDLSLNDREIDLHLIEPTGALQVRTSRLLDHGQLLRSMEHLPRRDGTDQEPDRPWRQNWDHEERPSFDVAKGEERRY